MTPQINQKIKITFQNNSAIEGIVQSWSEKESTLLQVSELIIIPNTARDVLFITILQNSPSPTKKEDPPQPSEQDLKNKKLADLHILKMKAEKEILAKKFKEHHIDSTKASHIWDPEKTSQIEFLKNLKRQK